MNAKTGGCTIAGRPEPGRRDTTLAWGTGSTALFSTASWALLWAVPIRMRSSTDSRCSHGVGCTLPHAHMRANTKHQARMGRNSTRTRRYRSERHGNNCACWTKFLGAFPEIKFCHPIFAGSPTPGGVVCNRRCRALGANRSPNRSFLSLAWDFERA